MIIILYYLVIHFQYCIMSEGASPHIMSRTRGSFNIFLTLYYDYLILLAIKIINVFLINYDYYS